MGYMLVVVQYFPGGWCCLLLAGVYWKNGFPIVGNYSIHPWTLVVVHSTVHGSDAGSRQDIVVLGEVEH